MALKLLIALIITFLSAWAWTYLNTAVYPKKSIRQGRNTNTNLLSIAVSGFLGLVYSIIFLPSISENISSKHYLLLALCAVLGLIYLLIDLYKVKFRFRIIVQLSGATALALSGIDFKFLTFPLLGQLELGISHYIVVFFWMLFQSYTFNLLDKSPGVAPGLAIIVCLLASVIAFQTGQALIVLVGGILTAGILGTYRDKIWKAKAQFGGSTSVFIGFAVGILALEVGRIGNSQTINAIVPLSITAIPFLEGFLSVIHKLRKKENPFIGDQQHLYDRLRALNLSQLQSAYLLYFFTFLFGMIGVFLKYTEVSGIITLLLSAIILLLLIIYHLGYLEVNRNMILLDEEQKGIYIKKYIPFDRSRFYQNLLFFIFDVIFISLAFLVTYFLELRFGVPEELLIPPNEIILWLSWSVIFWGLIIGLNDLYMIEWDTSRVDEIFSILKILIVGAVFIFIINYRIDIPVLVTKGFFLIYLALLFISISIGRLILITFLRNYSLLEFKKRPTLIVGTNQAAVNIVNQIKHIPILKFKPVGFIQEKAGQNKKVNSYPVLGGISDIPDLIRQKNIKEAIIALEKPDPDKILNLIAIFDKYNVSIKLLPEYYSLMSGFRTSHIYGISLVRFISSSMKTWEWIVKRMLDILISVIVIIGFLPLWIILSLAIVIDSPGPVLYRQKRMGKNKLIFNLFKFRSMVKDAEKRSGPQWAQKKDPRITKVGKFLRKSGLDEIPQFINVLIGEMSIVGPRPERPVFIKRLEKQINFYTRRLLVKPGITGWAQLKYKYDESVDDVKQKLKDDLYYIRNMSVALDIKIIIQTAITLFQKWRLHH